MPLRASDRESCRKSGIVLTCFVDGRKRFRTVPLTAFIDQAVPDDEEAALADAADAAARDAAMEARVGRVH